MKNLLVLLIFIFCLITTLTAQNEISCYIPDESANSIMSIKTANAMATRGSLTEIFIVAVDSGASTQIPSWYNTVIGDLQDFFYQATFGNLNYNAIVLKKDANHAFEMPEYYLPFHGGCEHVHKETNVEAVIDSADKIYNFNDYDFDSDGQVEIHFTSIGPGSGGIGGACWTFTTNDTDSYGNYIDVVISAQSRGSSRTAYIGVIYHENGHALFNFPDMDHSGLTYWPHHGVGGFDIMSQVWGFEGVPSLYNPLFRDDRNWFTPTPITGNLNDAELHEFQKTGQCYVYSPSSTPLHGLNNQRFYITYHDRDLENNKYYYNWPYKDPLKGGVMIWHTKDDTVTKSGSYSNWRAMDVDIEAAHGKYLWTETTDTCINTYVPNALTGRDSLEIRKVIGGDVVSGGPYYGEDVGSSSIFYTPDGHQEFTFFSNPNSNWYATYSDNYSQNILSGLCVKDIHTSGGNVYADLEVNGFTITENTTLATGKWYIPNTITVNSGVTVNIDGSTTLIFENNATLNVNGTLNINGTTSYPVTFDFVNPNYSAKNGITFNSGSSGSLSNCIVKNAYYGVYCNGYLPSIANCTFTDNSYGVYVKNVGTTSNKILTCLFENNDTGIYCYNGDPLVQDCKMSDNLYGTYISSNSSPKFYYNTISDNDRNGVRCLSSQPYFGETHEIPMEDPNPGYNRITGNGYGGTSSNRYGIYSSYSSIFMGNGAAMEVMGGYNSIFGNNIYEVQAINYSTVNADWNFWNTANPSNVIYASSSSTVTYYAPLSTDPGGGSSIPKRSISESEPVVFNPDHVDMNNPNELLELALYYKYISNYDESITVLEEIMKKFPETEYVTTAMNEVFDISKISQKFDIESYCNDKLSSPKSSGKEKQASMIIKIAKSLRDGKTKEAEALCNDILKMYPNTNSEKMALFNLFLISGDDEKRSDEAATYLNMLKEKYPNEEETLHVLEMSGQEVDWSLAKCPENFDNENDDSFVPALPEKYSLSPNYPNPFNPSTTVEYSLPVNSNVVITIHNSLGQIVKKFTHNSVSAGIYPFVWDSKNNNGLNLSSGLYYLHFSAKSLEDDGESSSKSIKLLLVR